MAIVTPDHLILLSREQPDSALLFDLLDRKTLAQEGCCALHFDSLMGERPHRRSLTIDAPETAKPAIRRAFIRWMTDHTLLTLDNGTVIDNGRPSPEAEALYQLALPQTAAMTRTSRYEDRFWVKTPDSFAWVMNLRRRCDGLMMEAGFVFPGNTVESWDFLSARGQSDTSIRLRIIRLVSTEAELQSALAEAGALRDAWFDKPREEVRRYIAEKQKAFLQRITAQLKPLGFRKKAMHWTYTRPDGYHVDFNAQKSAYSDGFYFNLLLTEPEQHPWYMGLINERPLGELLDWQTISGEDFDDLLRAVVHTRILPLINEPISALVSTQGGLTHAE